MTSTLGFAGHVRDMDRFVTKAHLRDDTLFDELAALPRQDMVTIAAFAFAASAAYQITFGAPSFIELVTSADEAVAE